MDKYNRNEIAKFYWNSRTIVDEFTEAQEPIYWRSFFETIKYPESLTVLDLGCGGGRNTYMLAELGFRVEACDLHENMLKATWMKIQKLNSLKRNKVHIQKANMLKLPYETESLDIILSNGIYHNTSSVDEFEQAIRESARILKKGGLLCLNVFSNAYVDETLNKQTEEFLFVTPDGLDMMLLPPIRILDILNTVSLVPYNETVSYESKINVGTRSVLRGIFCKK